MFTNSDITQRLSAILHSVKNYLLVDYPVYSLNLWFEGCKMHKLLGEVHLKKIYACI